MSFDFIAQGGPFKGKRIIKEHAGPTLCFSVPSQPEQGFGRYGAGGEWERMKPLLEEVKNQEKNRA